MQLHGGYGHLRDFPLVRDLRVHQILKGASGVIRVIVARELSGTRNVAGGGLAEA
jgi:alkylation response protein AidB-like acyl-CoA dehydrogenase